MEVAQSSSEPRRFSNDFLNGWAEKEQGNTGRALLPEAHKMRLKSSQDVEVPGQAVPRLLAALFAQHGVVGELVSDLAEIELIPEGV